MTETTQQAVAARISPDCAHTETARRIQTQFHISEAASGEGDGLILQLNETGLSLVSGGQTLQGDLTRMLPRVRPDRLNGELLVRAAKIKDPDHPLTAVDATAGLGEDSFLLAAAGFQVTLFERNPIIFELLRDTLSRAAEIPELASITARMRLIHGDSVAAMKSMETAPDVILLDPMFPERQKSALVKKKLQMIQKLEFPCLDEREMFLAAAAAKPKKLVIKRPPKGPYLAGVKPDYSISGKAVRFDCFASPGDRLHKFQP